MGDRTRGLYVDGKFIVQRKDGTDAPGGKHDGCEYFVLDITHDPHHVPALRAYAIAARADGYELLADDLERIVGSGAAVTPSDAARRAAEEIAHEINGGDREDCAYPPALVALLDNCTIANEKALTEWLEAIISKHFGSR